MLLPMVFLMALLPPTVRGAAKKFAALTRRLRGAGAQVGA